MWKKEIILEANICQAKYSPSPFLPLFFLSSRFELVSEEQVVKQVQKNNKVGETLGRIIVWKKKEKNQNWTKVASRNMKNEKKIVKKNC